MSKYPLQKLLKAKAKLEEQFLLSKTTQKEAFSAFSGTKSYGFENIVGVGISEKIRGGFFVGEECVTVYVVSKEPLDAIAAEARVPGQVDGVKTDVVVTGEFRAFPHRGTYRPAPGGVSIGHYQVTAGTLGCLVRRGEKLFILSNNHVIANVNEARLGDPIYQPGPYDGGNESHTIARLSEYVPITFSGEPNKVDAALAEVSPSFVTRENIKIGKISAKTAQCNRWMIVKKSGRTTQFTRGVIVDCNATVRVSYGPAGSALFQDQILVIGIPYIYPFSSPGDSGSLIVGEFRNMPVGLLFAGSFTHTIANKIDTVLSQFNVEIAT